MASSQRSLRLLAEFWGRGRHQRKKGMVSQLRDEDRAGIRRTDIDHPQKFSQIAANGL
jgi:hypothetical protein